MNITRTACFITLVAPLLLSAGCGSGSDDDFGFARVENLAAADNTIPVGDGTAVAADFSFDHAAVDDGDRVFLVIRVPQGLELRPDTSELETTSGDDKIGAEVTNCATGEQFLLYDMDRFDLDNVTSPSRNADGRLKFTLDGLEPGVNVVRAYASTDRPLFGCGQDFLTDEEIAIQVD
ncbi:MAG: hypothetical protein U0136_06920 [Bdellovibrionota bacterium]